MAIWNNEAERGQSLSVESRKEKGNSNKRQYDYDRIISHTPHCDPTRAGN